MTVKISLRDLYNNSSFKRNHKWENLKINKVDVEEAKLLEALGDKNPGYYIHIPECSYLGSSGIMMNDYENSGYDALFIQELIERYKKSLRKKCKKKKLEKS